MSGIKSYTLSCHCQTHAYRLTLSKSKIEEEGIVCDCSFCLKKRIVWAFVPQDSLVLTRGAGSEGSEDLTKYRFATKTAEHLSCGKCGTYLIMKHNRPDDDRHFINLRAIRDLDFDLWKLPLTVYNSIERDPKYQEISLSDVPGAEEYLTAKGEELGGGREIYAGSCHCKAIKFACVTRRIDENKEEEMVDCACSICLGNGAVWIYPFPNQVIFHPSEPSNPHKPLANTVSRYTFGKGTNIHSMCRTCGCHIYEHREVNVDDDIGLNLALFSRAGEWMRDIHGVGEGKQQFVGIRDVSKTLPGLCRNPNERKKEPLFQIRT